MKIQREMRMAIAVSLACLVAFQGGCTWGRVAKKRSGAEVVVRQTGGAEIKGELVGVSLEGLVLETKKGAAKIPVADIESLWTVKRMSGDGQTAVILTGLVGGIALGVGAAKASGIEPDNMGDSIALGGAFLLGGMLVGLGGAALIAKGKRKGDVYDFRNKPQGEIELLLRDLRKLARVPSYR